MITVVKANPLFYKEYLQCRNITNKCNYCPYKIKWRNWVGWFSPFFDFMVDKLIDEINKDQHSFDAVAVDQQCFKLNMAFQP
jgi:hypothetical protein